MWSGNVNAGWWNSLKSFVILHFKWHLVRERWSSLVTETSFKLPDYETSFATSKSLHYENEDITNDCEVVKPFNRSQSWRTVKFLSYPTDWRFHWRRCYYTTSFTHKNDKQTANSDDKLPLRRILAMNIPQSPSIHYNVDGQRRFQTVMSVDKLWHRRLPNFTIAKSIKL